MNILLIESNIQNTRKMEKWIKNAGHNPVKAVSIESAVNHARINRFDLAFFDLSLLEDWNYQKPAILEELWENMFVAVMADHNSRLQELAARKMGVVSYLIKPVPEEHVVDIVNHISSRINSQTGKREFSSNQF